MLHAIYGLVSQNLLFLNKFWIISTFRDLFQVIKNSKPFKIYILMKEAVEVIEATEVADAVGVIEAI